jgi:hypothetical protein
MLVVATNPRQVEAQLAAGRLACPACGGRLSRWGFTAQRTVRARDALRQARQRRACCRACGATHVLVPASVVARRRDAVEVIGEALALAARGVGHRRIAARLDRPPGTVRGWLRAARRNAEQLRASGVRWFTALDPEPGPVTAAGSALGDAVEAILLAVRAWVRRFGPDHAGPWERAQSLTSGLFSPRPALPP